MFVGRYIARFNERAHAVLGLPCTGVSHDNILLPLDSFFLFLFRASLGDDKYTPAGVYMPMLPWHQIHTYISKFLLLLYGSIDDLTRVIMAIGNVGCCYSARGGMGRMPLTTRMPFIRAARFIIIIGFERSVDLFIHTWFIPFYDFFRFFIRYFDAYFLVPSDKSYFIAQDYRLRVRLHYFNVVEILFFYWKVLQNRLFLE